MKGVARGALSRHYSRAAGTQTPGQSQATDDTGTDAKMALLAWLKRVVLKGAPTERTNSIERGAAAGQQGTAVARLDDCRDNTTEEGRRPGGRQARRQAGTEDCRN